MRRCAFAVVASMCVVLACTTPAAAQAAPWPEVAENIPVDVGCGDVAGLRGAIEAANARTGDDTIALAPFCTYTFTDQYTDQEALPAFTKKSIVLEGNGSTIRRADGDLRFRLINVASTGRLFVRNLTVANGWARTPVGLGAISVFGELFVSGSRIWNNHAGGVLVRSGAQASFVDTSISGNTQVGLAGAGIHNDGSLYLERVDLSGNSIPALLGQPSGAGGLYNKGSALVKQSRITRNRARDGAGVGNNGQLIVVSSSITDNDNDTGVPGQTTGRGAAIVGGGEGATLEVVNSTIAANWSSWPGGAVVLGSGTATFRHATIAHNFTTSTANGTTGALTNLDDKASITLENTILADNTRANCTGAVIDRGYNLTFGNSSGCPSSFLYGDPKLRGTFWLRPGVGSAALDRIPPLDPTTVAPGSTCESTDQRGMPRPGGPACDIGAFENQPPGTPGPITSSASPNQGVFGLHWPQAVDPDEDPVSYQLESRAGNETSWRPAGSTSSPQVTFSPESPEREGRRYYRVLATDGRLPSPGYGSSSEVVVDRTPPDAPTAVTDRAPEYVDPDTQARWFADSVAVSFTPGSDPPLADGSPGSGIVSTTAPQTFASTGEHTAAGNSADAAGNQSPDGALTLHVDADSPTVAFGSCPAEVLLGSSRSIAWTAADAGSGLAGPTSGAVELGTSSIGSYIATQVVSDKVGHTASASCAYNVIWDFQGFRAPLRPFPSFANVGAGSRVNVVFSLGGDQGLDVFAAGYPASASVACGSSDALGAGDPTTASGPLSLSPSGEYTYSWVTGQEWRGTCRQLIVKLRDGTVHRANVEFK